MTIRDFFKRAAPGIFSRASYDRANDRFMSGLECFGRAGIAVLNRVCWDKDGRDTLICMSTLVGVSGAGFTGAFGLMELTGHPVLSVFGAMALTFNAMPGANRWMKWACEQPMP